MRLLLRSTLIVWCCAAPDVADAAINFSLTFNDPNGDLAGAATAIQSHVVAAGQLWASHLIGNANIEVVVRPNPAIPYAEGYSVTNNFVRNNGAFNVYEQGMAAEIRTGVDPNGAAPDVEIQINPGYVFNELWFDPDPYARTAVVDINRTDAMSTFLHEFGHALGYNGWINDTTGTYPGDYQSTFDERVSFNGTNFFFNGAEASGRYGNPVPLTYDNVFHVANFSPRPGEDLILDVMNGLVFYRGTRYDIKPLNIAMLRDAGVPAFYIDGDYDLNGSVEMADYAVWRAALSSTSSPYVDGNHNGVVDGADYVVWRKNLGATFGSGTSTPSEASSQNIPEPAGIALLAGVILSAHRVRGVRHRRTSNMRGQLPRF